MQYRSEIDGLRALAVLPVILFHAGFHSFSGGFIGVDVFFVISGYLITSIILRDLETGTFSLKHFYERRARRILPTLFFVFLTCIPLATLLMSPSELKDFALSLGASLVFISNIFFWGQSGYFDTASELKPLIHTWSLSVEEQFYVLFPLALAGLWRSKKRNMIAALIALAVASLLLSEYASRTFPSFNFFWLATRAWELLAGALCAFLVIKPKRIRDDLLSLIGIILITASIFYFDSSTRSPSAISLMPVMGTCLVILFGTQTTITAQLLSLRPFVAIGLISYSAYIWHQPLFAFSRIGAAREPSAEWMLLLILVVLLFAYLT
jgi:peptidoglycan/LPS O-acetylase OafA/YrhL